MGNVTEMFILVRRWLARRSLSWHHRVVTCLYGHIAERPGCCRASHGRAGRWPEDVECRGWSDYSCSQLLRCDLERQKNSACRVLRGIRASLLHLTILTGILLHFCLAQDLSPRAYLITPLHSNAVNLTYSFFDGGVEFNGVVPIEGATGRYSVPIVGYYHSFGLLGRSANIAASLPYGVGTFRGSFLGTNQEIYRSGLFDLGLRFSVNLKGGPAMPVSEFIQWKQKTVLGASLKMIAPTGQYSPTKLVNWGLTAGPSSPSLATRSALANGCWMDTLEYGSSPRTRNSIRFPHRGLKHKTRSAPSKVT
jgi:hypothetical protein